MKLILDLDKDDLEELKLVKEFIEIRIDNSHIQKYLQLNKADSKGMAVTKNVINHLIDLQGPLVPINNIEAEAKKNKRIDRKNIKFVIGQLKKSGSIHEPRKGFIEVI